eukprot:TRINITY_DN113951_c0_g1_i1.p1 TRINITY_DN113951_c0_g1~~TRINITY_DN113951_c0_g1_i1.p1  ORF type:complete len:341 (-),score=41.14 TRINITY_DN113951_c0_g1_i1:35-1057(-)
MADAMAASDDALRASDLSELWHPYVLMYALHSVVALIAVPVSLHFPRLLIAVMIASGILWPLTWVLNQPLWGQDGTRGAQDLSPGSYLWWGVFLKWLIVNFCATVPVLYLRVLWAPSQRTVLVLGAFVYVILGANVVWTIGLIKNEVVDWVNHATAILLTLSLILHCVALRRHHAREFFEVRKGFVYGYATPFPWLMCYTIWNALFVASISIGMTLQDILFWCMMLGYQAMDGQRLPIEMYFAFARPIQLGTYIALSDWVGTFIPFFRDAATLKSKQPLNINGNAYFFYIVCCNFVFSIFITYWAAARMVRGFHDDDFADSKFLSESEGNEDSENSDEDA